MSKTTILERLKGKNPFDPDYLTAELGYLSCGFRDGSWPGGGAWCANSFTNIHLVADYKNVRNEMETIMSELQGIFPTHAAMLSYFKEHAHEVCRHHAYPTYHMWLTGRCANYRIMLRANTNMAFCLSIIALKSVA